jgi:hypothetical protein
MEEVSSDDNRRPRDNEEEDDVVKGKNQVDDNADSEEMYKSIEGEESGEAGNGIQDDSYAGDSDDTTEPEEEEHLGGSVTERTDGEGKPYRHRTPLFLLVWDWGKCGWRLDCWGYWTTG